jgi:hypothetical protein
MPIGFSDLLKTTAQLDNNLSKGIVSTDDTYGGVRSKIDDWTDLHLSTYNGGSAYTFQDDGTASAPGHFKEYSTMFYVADGRALVEDAAAVSDFIRLDASGNYVSSGGTKYVVPSGGTAEPEFWVLDDATQIGGAGSGTDKLPTFTITGTQGSGSTAVPAGYQKLQVLTNAAAADGAVSLSSDLDSNLLSNTDGELDLDTQTAALIFAGPATGAAAKPTFRALATTDIPDLSATYLTSETSHADVVVDGDFGSQGIMLRGASSGEYSILTDNSANWNTAFGWGDHASGGYVSTTHTGNVSITGNLTVSGDFIQANSTAVNFEDAVLQLSVPRGSDNAITAEDGSTAADSGLDFVKVTTVGSIDEFASMRYDVSADKIKFTRHADGGTFSAADIISGADNVAALKFDVTTSSLGAEAAGTNDIADLYGTASSARSNDSNVRSLGSVSKCTIDITTDATDDGSNYAPVAAASNGYPIQHDLGTSSVFVFALKTHQAGGDGNGGAATLIAEPQPVFCKFKVITSNIVEVSVGITKENEKYDIIVIG